MTKRNIKGKPMLAKWLLISTLFVSLFGFSGPVSQSSLQQQKASTEVVFSNNVKPGYRAAGYKSRAPGRQTALNCACVSYSSAIFAYDRLAKVKFDQLSRQPVLVTVCRRFYHEKTIQQSSGDDIRASLIG